MLKKLRMEAEEQEKTTEENGAEAEEEKDEAGAAAPEEVRLPPKPEACTHASKVVASKALSNKALPNKAVALAQGEVSLASELRVSPHTGPVAHFYAHAWRSSGTLAQAAHLDGTQRAAFESKVERMLEKTNKLDARGAHQGRALEAGRRGFASDEDASECDGEQQRQMVGREQLCSLACLVCRSPFSPEQMIEEGYKGVQQCAAKVRAAPCYQARPGRGPLCATCTFKCVICKTRVCSLCLDPAHQELMCKACGVGL